VPATLPQHLRSDCLHAPPTPGSHLAKPPNSDSSPARNRPSPQHATSSAQSRRSQSPAPSAAARRCTQRTIKVQRRQLRHPSETRCQRRCPIISDRIDCTQHRPWARPSQTPTTRYSPARNRFSPQHATSSMHSRRSQERAHSTAGHRCTQRTTEVQRRQLRHPSETRCQRRCPIISEVIACTPRRPSARRLQAHTTRDSPARSRFSPQHRTTSIRSRRSHALASAHSAAAARAYKRTTEVQRRQLRHPFETRCQRRCPSCSDLIDCTHHRPSARHSQSPPPTTAPHATAPTHNLQRHHPCTAGVHKLPLTAQPPPMYGAYG